MSFSPQITRFFRADEAQCPDPDAPHPERRANAVELPATQPEVVRQVAVVHPFQVIELQQGRERAQLVQRAHGGCLEAECLRDRRVVDVGELREPDRHAALSQVVQLDAVGAIVHQDDHERYVLAHHGLERAHRHQEAAVAEQQHRGAPGGAGGIAQRCPEAQADRCAVAGVLAVLGTGRREVRDRAEHVAGIPDDVAIRGQQPVELERERPGVHRARRVHGLEIVREIEARRPARVLLAAHRHGRLRARRGGVASRVLVPGAEASHARGIDHRDQFGGVVAHQPEHAFDAEIPDVRR